MKSVNSLLISTDSRYNNSIDVDGKNLLSILKLLSVIIILLIALPLLLVLLLWIGGLIYGLAISLWYTIMFLDAGTISEVTSAIAGIT